MTNPSNNAQTGPFRASQRETLLQAQMLLFELDKTGMSRSDIKLLDQALVAIHTVIGDDDE